MSTRWYFSVQTRDPRDLDRLWTVGVRESLISRIRTQGHEVRLARLKLVHKVLSEDTEHIYTGWSRPDRGDCFVYGGFPGQDHRSLTIEVPPPPNSIFLVFVTESGEIDDWTWRKMVDGEPQGIDGDLTWTATP